MNLKHSCARIADLIPGGRGVGGAEKLLWFHSLTVVKTQKCFLISECEFESLQSSARSWHMRKFIKTKLKIWGKTNLYTQISKKFVELYIIKRLVKDKLSPYNTGIPWVLVHVPAASFPIQFPGNGLWKAAENKWSESLSLCYACGRLRRSFCIRPGTGLIFMALWWLNQQVEVLYLCLLFLCFS